MDSMYPGDYATTIIDGEAPAEPAPLPGGNVETHDPGQRASVVDAPMQHSELAQRGWAKNTESMKQHYFVKGRALCRLFYLQERYTVDPAPPSSDEQCQCCAREKAFVR